MEDSFIDRFYSFLKITNPFYLIYSDGYVLKAKEHLERDGYTNNNQNYHYRNVVRAAIHPVTGEIVPRIFRVSSIAPVNIPLVWAMITVPSSNVPMTLFLHWFNQSYNTATNYFNRSGNSMSTTESLKAYGLATVSACSIAYGLGKVVERGPPVLSRFGALIPLVATASANVR